jgi:hypothetical protein
MTNINLYTASAAMQTRIMDCADQETGEIDSDKLALIEGAFQDRAVACIAVNKTLSHKAAALKFQRDAIMAEYDRQIKTLEDNAQRLKDNLMVAMQATGAASVKSDDGMLSARLDIDRDEAVEIEDGATFPPELCNAPKPPAPSKSLIKAAILSGEPIAGARIVRRDRLTIK